MLQWVYHVVDRVESEAMRDPEYQELTRRQAALASDYDALLERLAPEDRKGLPCAVRYMLQIRSGIPETGKGPCLSAGAFPHKTNKRER